jgi:hypothetical protein
MEIRSYTIHTVNDLVASEQFRDWKHIPISGHRAVSQVHNPRASATDKILFVAFINNEIAGYVGVLPDMISQKGSLEKIGWLSCFWVDPAFRGKNISVALFSSVMDSWNNRILITNMAPGTINFYLRTDLYRQPLYKQGTRGYLRFNLATILPPKKPVFQKSVPLLTFLDATGNFLNSARLMFYPRTKAPHDLKAEYRNEITPDAENFISRMNRKELIKREKPELDWIIRFPWVMEGKPGDESRRYYFTSVAARYLFTFLEIYDSHEKMVAFLALSVRNDHLTLPYFWGEEESRELVLQYLINCMRDMKISMVTLFHPELSETLHGLKSPLFYKKKILRPYLCPKVLDITGLEFQDGDGDSVFT